jgi:hypothetical protein
MVSRRAFSPQTTCDGYTLAKQARLKSARGRLRRHLDRLTADGLAAATTAAIPQTTVARECAALRRRQPVRLAARAAIPWTG